MSGRVICLPFTKTSMVNRTTDSVDAGKSELRCNNTCVASHCNARMVDTNGEVAPGHEPASLTPFNGAPLFDGGGDLFSPGTLSSLDEYATNPRFLDLQEELRSVVFTGAASLAPSRQTSPTEPVYGHVTRPSKQKLDFGRVSIPEIRLIAYLRNWVTECAPYLDKFDQARHFGIQAPIIAQHSPALLYAILAFSARQSERKTGHGEFNDSLELYQESIRLLGPSLQAKDPNVLVAVCILACLELMSVSPRDWRRHVEGCAALFESFNVNGHSGGLLQAVFWCYARMELCGVIISNGTQRTVLPIEKWVPDVPCSKELRRSYEIAVRDMFLHRSRLVPDMHANWAVYLCAKTCDLICRRTRTIELGEPDDYDARPFTEQWNCLWDELKYWTEQRPLSMLPITTIAASGDQIFPEIFFAHWAAISANQLYHAACIMMLDFYTPTCRSVLTPQYSPIWHARRVCGISLTNPHCGNLINAIQPLYLAGKFLSHLSEHLVVARLFRDIESMTGWGATWRLRDLERAWGYNPGELLAVI